MSLLPDQMANATLGAIYDKLTMGDDDSLRSANDFFSFVTPGMPFPQGSLDFQERNFVPTHKDETENEEGEAVDMEVLQKQLGSETLKMYAQAEDLAYIMDFIPDASAIRDGAKRMNISTQIWNPMARLSDVYKSVLDNSQVVQTEVSKELQDKIDRVRKILQSQKTITDFDPDTFEEIKREVMAESQISIKYKEKKQAYDMTFMSYTNAQIAALNGNSEAVHYFARNEQILASQVRMALNDWIANGFKDIFERVTAFLEQAASTDLNLLMGNYREDMRLARVSNPAVPGSRFYFTKLVPSGFASSDYGWTQFSFSNREFESHYDKTRTSWGASGGLNLGLFRIGGGGGQTKTEVTNDVDWSTFSVKFSIAQVPILRWWFHGNLLTSKYWRFHPDASATGSAELLSDGKVPPQGQLVAFPTTAIFVKDLELKFKTHSGDYRSFSENLKAAGGFSWGPFSLGGRYSKSNKEVDVNSSTTSEGIKVDGMQLIGFRCHSLPMSPDPLEGLAEDKWV